MGLALFCSLGDLLVWRRCRGRPFADVCVCTAVQALFKDEVDPEQTVVLTRKDLKEKFTSDQDLIALLQEHEKNVEGFVEQLDADPEAEITVRSPPSIARPSPPATLAQGRLA